MRSLTVAANQRTWARVVNGAGLAVLAVALIGCASEPVGVLPPRPAARALVRGFTEATAVRAIHGVPPFALAITSGGLERWDLRSDTRVAIGEDRGLPAGALVGHELAEQRRALWIATEQALARYDVDRDQVTVVPPPPPALGLGSLAGATLGAAVDGGVWVGLPRGLFYARDSGAWAATGITAPVTAIAEVGGDLWVGTALGLFVSDAGAAPLRLGPDRGCDLAAVGALVPAPEGGVLVLGTSGTGAGRVVLARPNGCESYRVSPARTWQAIASRPGEVLILSDRTIYGLARPRTRGRRLARDGMRLLPVPRLDGERPQVSPFVLTPLEVAVPAGARTLAAAGGEILIGTESLGIARTPARSGRPLAWLRAGELAADASSLTVACRTKDDCWVATGGRRAWRFDGAGFRPTVADDRRVLAMTTGDRGGVLGLLASGNTIAIAAPDGDGWKDLGLRVETPGQAAELSFARRSPAGHLWLGLRYRDGDEVRPFGVAVVNPALGVVAYHRESDDPGEVRRGVLPVPLDVSDVAFRGDETWLVSGSGLARIAGDKVELHPSAAASSAGDLHGVAAGGDRIYVGGGRGVLTFESGRWRAWPRLAWSINDLALDDEGRLWLATDRGVVVSHGERVRRIDRRRGLLEDRILDVAVDRFGRVWLRGEAGIVIVTP